MRIHTERKTGVIVAVLSVMVCMVMVSTASTVQGAQSVGFSFQVVDSYAQSVSASAIQLAVDSQGYAHLAYGKIDGGFGIYYSTNRGGSWSTQLLDGPFTSYSLSSWDPSAWIFVDSQDRVHIFYNYYVEEVGNSVIHGGYATKMVNSTGGFTKTELFSDKVAFIKAVALGPGDVISALCTISVPSAQVMAYVTKAPSGPFVSSPIPFTGPMNYGFASMDVASDGSPHIALVNSSSTYNATTSDWDEVVQLEYMHKSGAEWEREVVDGNIGRGYFVNIGLDSSDQPRILYGRDDGQSTPSEQQIRYVEHSSGGWGVPRVIQEYGLSMWIGGSMAVYGDETRIVYPSSTPALVTPYAAAFNYTHGSGNSFVTQLADADLSGPAASIAVDGSGGIHLAFVSLRQDMTGTNLLYGTTGTIAPVLTKPQNVSATPGDASVQVNWSAPAGGAAFTNYIVEVSDSASFHTILQNATVPSTQLSYTFSNLTNGADYFFRVKTTNGAAESAYSDVATAKPSITPKATGNLDLALVAGIGALLAVVAIASVYMLRRRK